MSKTEVKTRILKLREEIEKHRKAYYEKDTHTISDAAYDSLFNELLKLEEENPEFDDKLSPTKRVGGQVLESFAKVRHEFPQWSYDNVFSLEELQKWEERNERYIQKEVDKNFKKEDFNYFCELKIDGLKVILKYTDGILVQAATRGDGQIGEDVTENVKTIRSVPFKVKAKGIFYVIGEVWLSKKDFEKLNKERSREGLELYANPRNVAAGTLRQLDTRITASRNLKLFAYEVDGLSLNSQEEVSKFLAEQGFLVNIESKLCKNLEGIQKMYEKWNNKSRNEEQYGIDGLVIKINQKKYVESLGYTAKSPRGGVAYKFSAEEGVTKLLDVTYQVGRTGVVTPVAELAPVQLSGSTVKRATLHNFDEIERLGVKIGDSVMVRKAGDIIPQVFGVLVNLRTGKEKKIVEIKKCPICGSGLTKDTVGDGVKLVCPNPDCEAKRINKIIYFASRKIANIEGLGESTVVALYEAGFVRNVSDIYKLTKKDILTLEGFKEKSAQNLLDGIENAKTLPLEIFIIGLSIKNVGEETSTDLAKHFKTLGNFLNLEKLDLDKIYGIGDKIILEIVDFLKNTENKKEIKNLLKYVKVKDYESRTKSAKLENLRFVITGSYDDYSREDIEKIIKENGGSVQSAVNAKTSYLIVGEDAGSKLDKANKLGIKTIDIREFLKLV